MKGTYKNTKCMEKQSKRLDINQKTYRKNKNKRKQRCANHSGSEGKQKTCGKQKTKTEKQKEIKLVWPWAPWALFAPCVLILSQSNYKICLFITLFCLLFPCVCCFLYVPFICGIGRDSPDPWARGEWWATQRQVQRDSQLAAGRCASFRLPGAPPTAYTFIAPAPAILSCSDKLKAPCTVRLIRQSVLPKAPKCNALRCAALRCAELRCAALRCAALRCAPLPFHLVYWLGLPWALGLSCVVG